MGSRSAWTMKQSFIKYLLLSATFHLSLQENKPCVQRDLGHSSFVCVCNSTYCDTYDKIEATSELVGWVSDRRSKRLSRYPVSWQSNNETVGVTIDINKSVRYQEMIGFGGAFTDAAGINIAKLSTEAQEKLIQAYYSEVGSEYNIGRINIGGCDFSDRPYTYCDTEGDLNLDTFDLAHDDLLYKIPYIQMAKEVSSKEILLFGSAWSAPGWMKSNGLVFGQGYLLPQHYQLWADYHLRFLQAYKENGIEMWGLTAQNEPVDGNIPDFGFNCMGWNASTQATWIGQNLGPTLEENGFGHLKLMAFDDQRPLLPGWSNEVMENADAAEYVDGWAVHWYTDFLGLPSALDYVHEQHPDKFILFTEACTGANPWDLQKVLLGSWERGQEYINDILTNINHWSTGWVDWNLALDMNGGPNWAYNYVDAPIIVNEEEDEFYKNPMYYGLAHFSKFLPEKSFRIESDMSGYDADRILGAAFERPDGGLVVIVTNQHVEETIKIRIQDSERVSDVIAIGPQSVHSFLWV